MFGVTDVLWHLCETNNTCLFCRNAVCGKTKPPSGDGGWHQQTRQHHAQCVLHLPFSGKISHIPQFSKTNWIIIHVMCCLASPGDVFWQGWRGLAKLLQFFLGAFCERERSGREAAGVSKHERRTSFAPDYCCKCALFLKFIWEQVEKHL